MKKQLKIGVIGAGRIGKLHAFNLATRVPGAKLTAVSDVDKKSAEKLAAELGIPAVYSDYKKLLADP